MEVCKKEMTGRKLKACDVVDIVGYERYRSILVLKELEEFN